jgi:hypothetical protein
VLFVDDEAAESGDGVAVDAPHGAGVEGSHAPGRGGHDVENPFISLVSHRIDTSVRGQYVPG